MIVIDKPYVSDLLKQTIMQNNFPVIKTKPAIELGFENYRNLVSEDDTIRQIKSDPDTLIYTNSENAIGWISKNLSFTTIPEKINHFKDKTKFRKLISSLYPDFFYQQVGLSDLNSIRLDTIPTPFIIKPNAGFFSLGVHKVSHPDEWESVKNKIQADVEQTKHLYPEVVLSTDSFIIEQCIKGDEFAVDAYFNSEGKPVILNILKHLFSSGDDVSDRVYISSKEIIEEHIVQFSAFLRQVGTLADIKNFPVHVELRKDSSGAIAPIEINPIRFGGWCTTADMTSFAYGFNPYVYYLKQLKPNWKNILKNKSGKLYSIIVLDNSTGVTANKIKHFDYVKLQSHFEKLLEVRKINYQKFNVFGFLFAETKGDHFSELEWILKSDLKEFITL